MFVVLLAACWWPASVAAQPASALPNFTHVYVIVMENHEFQDIIGNASAPYINSLARQYAVGTAYTAITHPSLPNYMSLTGGETAFTDDCDGCTINAPSLPDQIEASGRSWKAYFEDMPAPCSTTDGTLYTTHHNPFVHYAPIVTDISRCQAHVVPLTALASDLASGSVPDFVWITPNLCSDMHDCPVASGDTWLSGVVPALLNTPDFATSILFLVWDEGTSTVGGGGRVAMLPISPLVKPGFQSTVSENHFSLLRTIQAAWGLAPLGQAANAAPMTEYFRTLPAACQDSLTLSDAGGTLTLGFTLASAVPATWSAWLIARQTSYKLWSAQIPAVFPAVSFNLPIPAFPPLGTVSVVTTLAPVGGSPCGDLKSVDTGAAP
jgi:acid phosphatase